MNFRNMSHEEVTPFIDHPIHGNKAHIEFCRRYLSGRLVEPPSSADIEDAQLDADEKSYDQGCHDERELIIEAVIEHFGKEAESIRELFPELPSQEGGRE